MGPSTRMGFPAALVQRIGFSSISCPKAFSPGSKAEIQDPGSRLPDSPLRTEPTTEVSKRDCLGFSWGFWVP